jgi:hypothetical protein
LKFITTRSASATTTFSQGPANQDYRDDGGGFGTTAKNVSEGNSDPGWSPDAAYRGKDFHTNTIFNGYATNDYTLDAAGDSTNLAVCDDGDDLSGTFTDDIIGQTRSTWYIGASEIVSAGGIGGLVDGGLVDGGLIDGRLTG